MTREVVDTEMTGLLDSTNIDYTASPHKLKPNFKCHCLVQRNVDDPTIVKKYVGIDEIMSWAYWELPKITEFVAHNGIDFDLLALKLLGILTYEVSLDPEKPSTINGKPVKITDTLVVSKCLNPDRYGGHSLDEWGKRVGMEKIDWRAKAIELGLIDPTAPKGAEFATYHPEMLVYCERDTEVNVKVYWALIEEMGDWNWTFPLWLEHAVRDVVTRQSHRGFWFDSTLAESNVRYLDQRMEEIRLIVEPSLPPKPMGVTKLKEFIPPKIQFKKNGEVSAVMLKWVEKHKGELTHRANGKWAVRFEPEGKDWWLPMSQEEPIKTHEPSKITDTTHIKGWLVELGWQPTQYKERDLTCDTKKKKLPLDKFQATVERWVEQTLNSPFCRDRLEALDTTRSKVREYLMKWDQKRPLKVYTNPTITVGMDKEIDPALLLLADKFPHAKLVSEYLTYAHRRNSILGGGVDPDDLDDDDEFAGKGFLAAERISQDGRIPTPADSCGAGTSRFKHRLVANIPRISSLFGDKMRAMFGSDVRNGYYQLGYDFASLESRIESHYCHRYDPTGEYCASLILEKPHDVHTKTAEAISKAIGQPFARQSAKPVKYACAYGAQPARVAKTVGCSLEVGSAIHRAYWEAAKPLALLGERLQDYWKTTGGKKFILGLDGRKIPTRSASALINSLFQSAGVICAKLTAVLLERKLRVEGFTVDFFAEDWRNKPFVQSMCMYHDEQQLEVHKSLIKWKTFETEEEAEEFKKSNPSWSEIGHSVRGYYVGWCRVGELITESVLECSRHFKLNIDLGADYVLGRNWGETH